MSARRADLVSGLLIALAFAFAAWLYKGLPNPVPTHWNLAQQANGFTPKPWGAFLLPLITLGTYAVLRVLPAISPKGFRMEGFIAVYRLLAVVIVAFLFAVTVVALLKASGSAVDMARLVPMALGVLFLILGNYMGKLQKNFFIGIRTPWTLANDEVWSQTHRLGGKLFMAAGIFALAAGALGLPSAAVIAVLVAAALGPAVYSYILYRRIG